MECEVQLRVAGGLECCMRTLLPFYGVPKWLSLQHAPQLASLERGELRHASGGYRDASCTAGSSPFIKLLRQVPSTR